MHAGASLTFPCHDSCWCRIQISIFLWIRMASKKCLFVFHISQWNLQWRFFLQSWGPALQFQWHISCFVWDAFLNTSFVFVSMKGRVLMLNNECPLFFRNFPFTLTSDHFCSYNQIWNGLLLFIPNSFFSRSLSPCPTHTPRTLHFQSNLLATHL